MREKSARTLLTLACFWLILTPIWSQTIISGRVADALTGEPISFVTVRFGENFTDGVVTNLEGEFEIKKPVKALKFTYLGYQTLTISLDTVKKFPLVVALQPDGMQTEEVQIFASSENPAHRIIKAVVANEKQNHPEKYDAYQAAVYNKIVYDFIYHDPDSIERERQLRLLGKKRLPADSLQARWERRLRGGHSLMMESVSLRMRLGSAHLQEKIIGQKISGFKSPEYAPLATLIQPFHFYDDVVMLVDVNYLNPISAGSWRKYDFKIVDTLLTGEAIMDLPGQSIRPGDTVYVITFEPEKGATFPGMRGTLWINTHGFAIQNVIAEPAVIQGTECRIRQAYSLVSGDYWYPCELDFEVLLPEYPSKKMGLRAEGRTYISEVDLSPGFKEEDFGPSYITKSDSANLQDTAFWSKYRVVALTEKEQTTYRVLDSIGEAKKFDKRLALIQKVVVFGRLEAGVFDINLERFFSRNTYEQTRLGVGFHTNEHLSRKFRAGGFIGYGLLDKDLKYGADLRWTFLPQHEAWVQLAASHDVVESGKLESSAIPPVFSTRNFRIFQRVDWYNGITLSQEARIFRFLKYNVAFSRYDKSPAGYSYEFAPAGSAPISGTFSFSDIRVGLRYSYREKLIDIGGIRLSLGTPFPVANITYTRSFSSSLTGGNFNYHKLEGNLSYSFIYKSLGTTSIWIEGGMISGNAPLMNNFAGNGIYSSPYSFRVGNAFTTMRFFEFIADRYVNVFFNHSFSTPFYKAKYSRPRLMLSQNWGISQLTHPEMHTGTMGKQAYDKGYLESGVFLNDVLRFSYLSLVTVGVGGGVYRRYGAYELENKPDNWATMFTVNFTTN